MAWQAEPRTEAGRLQLGLARIFLGPQLCHSRSPDNWRACQSISLHTTVSAFALWLAAKPTSTAPFRRISSLEIENLIICQLHVDLTVAIFRMKTEKNEVACFFVVASSMSLAWLILAN